MNKRTKAGTSGALRGFGVAAALSAGLVAYPVFFRRQCLTWGARPDEVSRKLPGDELLPGAGTVATRAITIDAPPAAIWPWLVQMGSGRGGVYTYDWIENLFGLDMHSTRRILPQHQDVKVGDEFPLISRNRIAAAGAWPARLFGMLVMEPGSLIMERKMLLGIKERAEHPQPAVR